VNAEEYRSAQIFTCISRINRRCAFPLSGPRHRGAQKSRRPILASAAHMLTMRLLYRPGHPLPRRPDMDLDEPRHCDSSAGIHGRRAVPGISANERMVEPSIRIDTGGASGAVYKRQLRRRSRGCMVVAVFLNG